MSDRLQRLEKARLYLICDDRPSDFLRATISGGVDIVQLRMKDRPDHEVLAAAQRFAPICAERDVLFILNDRPDLAVAADADGVHVGQDDAPAAQARALLGRERLVGLSTHSRDQIERAGAAGVDYIGVGPVNATPTKPGRAAVGTALVRHAAQRAGVPFFAIGGIDLDNVGAAVDAGAQRIAVVRALTLAEDPEVNARALKAAVTGASVGAA